MRRSRLAGSIKGLTYGMILDQSPRSESNLSWRKLPVTKVAATNAGSKSLVGSLFSNSSRSLEGLITRMLLYIADLGLTEKQLLIAIWWSRHRCALKGRSGTVGISGALDVTHAAFAEAVVGVQLSSRECPTPSIIHLLHLFASFFAPTNSMTERVIHESIN